ncbi:MAG: CYTH domain-containing protein [Nakamurella multipartita]
MAARQKKFTPGTGAGPATPAPAGPTRQLEIETKLELDPDAPLPALTKRKRLATVGITGVAEPISHHLDALYYDTDQLDLLRSKVTLRRRTGGADAGWHLKLPAIQGARTEIGLPLSAARRASCPSRSPRWSWGTPRAAAGSGRPDRQRPRRAASAGRRRHRADRGRRRPRHRHRPGRRVPGHPALAGGRGGDR